MTSPASRQDGMGALLYPDGTCRFRVWAPFASRVQLVGDFTHWDAGAVDLARDGDTGNWSADVPQVTPDQKYQYLITNVGGPGNDDSQVWRRADARALQVESADPRAAGYVVAPIDQSSRPAFTPPPFEDYLLYQLHVGSFAGLNDFTRSPLSNRTARFVDVIDKLAYIRDLGFTGIELLPICTMSTSHPGVGADMGYEISDLFAPEGMYATDPARAADELRELIDAAHAAGLAVILDVVYSHSSSGQNRYWRYDGNCYGTKPQDGGIYFENGHHNDFGSGFALWRREVKDLATDNARLFLRDYRVDGLRLDAVQLIPPDAVKEITGALRTEFPGRYLIAEYNPTDADSASKPLNPYRELNFHAVWQPGEPHRCFHALSGQDVMENLRKLVGDIEHDGAWSKVRYLAGSHDQIYDHDADHPDRGFFIQRSGGRQDPTAQAKARLAWALTIALPGTPMLFMGTEGALDGWWDPLATHGEHRIDWARMGDPIGQTMQRLVKDANAIRRREMALRAPGGRLVHVDDQGRVMAFIRYGFEGDRVLVVVNAGDQQWEQRDYRVNLSNEGGAWTEIFNSQAEIYGGRDVTGNPGGPWEVHQGSVAINLPRWSVLMFRG